MAMTGGIDAFLQALHRTPTAIGVEELSRLHDDLPRSRSIYRWHRALGNRLMYYPSITYQSIGLIHVHVIITAPRHDWQHWPYTVRALWIVRGPGETGVYLHCLVPQEHVGRVRALVREHEPTATMLVTPDGQQFVPALNNPPITYGIPPATDLLERYPLVIPVVCAHLERRASLQELWETIYRRLGDRVWQYLPRRARRFPHNGKHYVRRVLNLLNEHGIFRQYVIRYDGLAPNTIDLLLLLRSCDNATLSVLGQRAPIVEHYGDERGAIVVCSSTMETLRYVFTDRPAVSVAGHYFIDHQRNSREPLQVRFAYERLFDPSTSSWVFPNEELCRTFSP